MLRIWGRLIAFLGGHGNSLRGASLITAAKKVSKWVKVAQSCPTLLPHELYSPQNSPGQKTGVGSLSLLRGIFPTQGWNPGLPQPQGKPITKLTCPLWQRVPNKLLHGIFKIHCWSYKSTEKLEVHTQSKTYRFFLQLQFTLSLIVIFSALLMFPYLKPDCIEVFKAEASLFSQL